MDVEPIIRQINRIARQRDASVQSKRKFYVILNDLIHAFAQIDDWESDVMLQDALVCFVERVDELRNEE